MPDVVTEILSLKKRGALADLANGCQIIHESKYYLPRIYTLNAC